MKTSKPSHASSRRMALTRTLGILLLFAVIAIAVLAVKLNDMRADLRQMTSDRDMHKFKLWQMTSDRDLIQFQLAGARQNANNLEQEVRQTKQALKQELNQRSIIPVSIKLRQSSPAAGMVATFVNRSTSTTVIVDLERPIFDVENRTIEKSSLTLDPGWSFLIRYTDGLYFVSKRFEPSEHAVP